MKATWGGRFRLPILSGVLFVAGCGLPRQIRQDIASEKQNLQSAQEQIRREQKTVADELSGAPAFFNDLPGRFRDAQAKLDRAGQDLRDLESSERSGGKEATKRAERLLNEERQLRTEAVAEADKAQTAAARWLEYKRDPQQFRERVASERKTVAAVDLTSTAQAVERAERDWPAKKADLEGRLSALKQERETAPAASADVNADVATDVGALMRADDTLRTESISLPRDAGQLRGLCDQLYNAWDKVLDDLETARKGEDTVYREKLKTVTTHFVDVPEKKTQVLSDVKWVDVSASQYRAVENDLGMAISHKDAGLYDSEAQNVAQPAGFAYIAPPGVGSNQYGYWTHSSGGSFWTFLPQYLIMRELLWGHSYRPIVINEYNGYYQAQRSGRTYYGQETPTSAPKYGSHGTFTQQRYASSRYVQSGGFKGSGYASHGSSSGSGAPSSEPRFGSSPDSAGKRFGHGSGAPPSGRRFGSAPSSGRRFGGGSRRR